MEMRPIDGACAWTGSELAASDRWVRHLNEGHIDELDAVLADVERRGLTWRDITAADFPLPAMADLIHDLRDELENGSGLMKVRGLPVERYTEAQLQAIYFGIGHNIGTPVFQNRTGQLMRLIRDEGASVGQTYGQIDDAKLDGGKPFLSSYARTLTNGALRFHTDRTDVVGLLCVNEAARGGVSTICSSVSVMNEMLRRRPDLAALLFQPVFRSRHGEEAHGSNVVYQLPVFGVRDGKFTSHFSLTYIEAAQAAPAVPELTDAQQEAIDMLLELAAELAFEMTLERGDIQFLNSHVTYHGRSPFTDDHQAGYSRLLMRLWLSVPNNRPLPTEHHVLWGNVESGVVRGGIGQTLMDALEVEPTLMPGAPR